LNNWLPISKHQQKHNNFCSAEEIHTGLEQPKYSLIKTMPPSGRDSLSQIWLAYTVE